MPSPLPINRQLLRSDWVAWTSRGNQSSGTEIVLPSLSSTTRASQVVATLSASGMLTSIVETIIPCLHQNGLVFLDHAPDPPDVRRSQAATAFQQNGSQPEFGDASITFDMHMSGFIPVSHVEEEPVRASAEHGGHVWTSRHLREPAPRVRAPLGSENFAGLDGDHRGQRLLPSDPASLSVVEPPASGVLFQHADVRLSSD